MQYAPSAASREREPSLLDLYNRLENKEIQMDILKLMW